MPKKEIHPQYYPEAKVTCSSCKTVFNIGSTQPELTVEVCANCHPFYSGNEKILDAAGRVEKFKARKARAKSK